MTLLFVSFADAGWVSSGGDLIKDANNPWFIQNKPSINYCIEFDPKSFSSTKQDTQLATETVLKNWLQEWSNYFTKRSSSKNVILGSQTLVYLESCTGNEDLSFRFGWDSLTDSQKNYIKQSRKPQQLVGLAVRTSYDYRNLVGKGFIYIASDIGENKFDLGTNLVSNPWKHKYLLQLALTHEVGHIFGAPHSSLFSNIMSETIFEIALHKDFVSMLPDEELNNFHYLPLLENYKSYSSDKLDQRQAQFWGLNAGQSINMTQINPTNADYPSGYTIFEQSSISQKPLFVISLNKFEVHSEIPGNNSISIYLTDEQNVVPLESKTDTRKVIYSIDQFYMSGQMKNVVTGLVLPVSVRSFSDGLILSTAFKNDLIELKMSPITLQTKR